MVRPPRTFKPFNPDCTKKKQRYPKGDSSHFGSSQNLSCPLRGQYSTYATSFTRCHQGLQHMSHLDAVFMHSYSAFLRCLRFSFPNLFATLLRTNKCSSHTVKSDSAMPVSYSLTNHQNFESTQICIFTCVSLEKREYLYHLHLDRPFRLYLFTCVMRRLYKTIRTSCRGSFAAIEQSLYIGL